LTEFLLFFRTVFQIDPSQSLWVLVGDDISLNGHTLARDNILPHLLWRGRHSVSGRQTDEELHRMLEGRCKIIILLEST